ncbi:MAG: cobalamin biosynthesis protein [Lachnospiraceae bacterium]|nr:cobalamin biosynthesis protein [Lachnospiraceae bacterium]
MNISVISFTKNGNALAKKLKEKLMRDETAVVDLYQDVTLGSWVGEQFAAGRPIVFIGACGIAVRAIAPHLKSKLSDPPVLVMDEKGQFVIPLVSGHVGGANALAAQIAACMDAVPVITTATDLNGCFAVDLFAKENQLRILKKEGIAAVSGKLLSGESVTVSVEGMQPDGTRADTPGTEELKMPKGLILNDYPPSKEVDIVISGDEAELKKAVCPLRPKKYALGLGCRKGKSAADLEEFCRTVLEREKLSFEDVFVLASIDEKKEEEGICRLVETQRIPYCTFSAEELKAVKGDFHGSAFVEEQMGVDNVCERAAVLACGEDGRLILEKQAKDGMTLAVARRQWSARNLNWEI